MNENNKQVDSKDVNPKSTKGADKSFGSSTEEPKGFAKAVGQGTVSRSQGGPGWRQWLSKKWVFPATYMAVAAIILALMWVIQDSGDKSTKDTKAANEAQGDQVNGDLSDSALPVTAPQEAMGFPVENRDEVYISKPYYDMEASSQDKQAAVIENDGELMPNTGIVWAREDNKSFNVVATMSGTITRSEKVAYVGNLVEISHDNGLSTVYYSLTDVNVKKGDKVTKGELIGKAGRNELEKDLGVHLHFEVLENGQPVNPNSYLAADQTKASSISNEKVKADDTKDQESKTQ